MRTAIIGGGISGLSAAYELEMARRAGADVEYTLFEAGSRLGGVLASTVVNGAVLDLGPDSFLTEKTAAAELCHELGLGERLIHSNDADRKTFVVVRNRLVPLPDGLMFLVPTRLASTALTRLFSPKTKVRMALELLMRPRQNEEDESVAALVKRHFGQETVDRLADPLLSGIYGGDATQLSAQAVMPRLVEMECRYGSLTRGMLAARRQARARMAAGKAGGEPARAGTTRRTPRGVFTTLRGGMQELVDAVEAQLDPDRIRKATAVRTLSSTAEGWRVETDGAAERFDAVILATSAWAAGALLRETDSALSADLEGIPYTSSITVGLIYDASQMGELPEGFGFLVPAVEGRSMLACTFVHRKFPGRAPYGKIVLRAFLGGINGEVLMGESDEALLARVRRELSEILGEGILEPGVRPEYAQVTRWRRAMAQYAVGHHERMERIRERLAAHPSLRLAGNAYDGIGIPDCIRLGRESARELAAHPETVP